MMSSPANQNVAHDSIEADASELAAEEARFRIQALQSLLTGLDEVLRGERPLEGWVPEGTDVNGAIKLVSELSAVVEPEKWRHSEARGQVPAMVAMGVLRHCIERAKFWREVPNFPPTTWRGAPLPQTRDNQLDWLTDEVVRRASFLAPAHKDRFLKTRPLIRKLIAEYDRLGFGGIPHNERNRRQDLRAEIARGFGWELASLATDVKPSRRTR